MKLCLLLITLLMASSHLSAEAGKAEKIIALHQAEISMLKNKVEALEQEKVELLAKIASNNQTIDKVSKDLSQTNKRIDKLLKRVVPLWISRANNYSDHSSISKNSAAKLQHGGGPGGPWKADYYVIRP